MSAFYDNHITDLGRILLGDIQMGASFVPTKIVIGKGYMPQGKTTQTMTDVVDVVKELPLNKAIKNPDGDAIFGTVFTNEDIQQSFYYRELALYAKGVYFNQSGETERETDEILYSYGNAGDTAELIPAYSTGNVVERQLDLIVYIGNDAEVHLKMETGVYVTIPVFNDIVEQIDKRINAVWDTIQVIDEQVKQNAEDIQKIMEKGAGGIPPQIIVTSKNGSTVTCIKDETTLEQISSGTVTFDLDSYGTWHVTATSDDVPIETDVLVDDVKQYFITLDKAVATIEVKTSNGAAVKATNGYIVLTGSGSTTLSIPQNGEWVVTAALDDVTVQEIVNVTENKKYVVDLRMLLSIEITTPPDKTEYLTMEKFDKAGMVVTGTFKDGTTQDITEECSFSPQEMTCGMTTVNCTVVIAGVVKTTEITVTVNKRQGSISISPTSLSLTQSAKTKTITVTTENTGDIVATAGNASIVSVSVSGKTVTVTALKTGTTSITIYAKEDENYTQTGNKTCSVNAQLLPEKRPLEEMSWADIRKISDAGLTSEYWSVGDTKTITLNGTVSNVTFENLSIQVFIIGFNHNAITEGNNRIHFQIGKISNKLVALKPGDYTLTVGSNFVMNKTLTNNGGWKSSYMRNTVLGNNSTPIAPASGSFLAVLPADLRSVIKSVVKHTDNIGESTTDNPNNITATTDYLFLLSEFEVFGSIKYSNTYEQGKQKNMTIILLIELISIVMTI